MRARNVGVFALAASSAGLGCDGWLLAPEPGAPVSIDASYYARSVTVTWELAGSWDGESFRIYSRGDRDPEYYLIAELTSCSGGWCSYVDLNVSQNTRYEYYVSAYDWESEVEAASDVVEVWVPDFGAPPAPEFLEVVPLDGANYLWWDEVSLTADDFSFYRVYVRAEGGDILIGETDSEGFLDERAENGNTYEYSVSAVDDYGHEGHASRVVEGTPRPDFTGEVVFDYFTRRPLSGFRFRPTEREDPLVDGDSPGRHFRLEVGEDDWWLVPGPGAAVFPVAFRTTALRCGPGADSSCEDVREAPTAGYVERAIQLEAQLSYIFKVVGDDGKTHYGVIRSDLLGFSGSGDPFVLFAWAYQAQANNVGLMVNGG